MFVPRRAIRAGCHDRVSRFGFTLVEVLIVVVILGILAASVLPQFNAVGEDAKESALKQDLQLLRGQFELYRTQHGGAWPGSGSTDPTKVTDALLKASDAGGTTAAPGTAGYPYGPYIVGQVPPNPYNNGRAFKIVADVTGTAPDMTEAVNGEKVGWIYNPATGQLKANATGQTADGKALDTL